MDIPFLVYGVLFNIQKGFKNANSTRETMLSLRSFELRTLSPLTRTPSMNATWCVKASDLRRSLDVPARRTCEVRTLSPLSRAPSMNAIRCVKASTFAMSRRSKQMQSRQLGMDISISRAIARVILAECSGGTVEVPRGETGLPTRRQARRQPCTAPQESGRKLSCGAY